jgi:hypothetical protein
MCNIALISSLIAAAQLSLAAAIGLFGAASYLNGNIFRAGGAPALMILGAAALLGTVILLRSAARAAAGCASVCAAQTATLITRLTGISAGIVALGAVIASATLLSFAPLAAAAAIGGIVSFLGLVSLTFITLAMDLAALSACAGAAGRPPPLGIIIVTILSVLLAAGIGAVVVAGIAGGILPLLPVPPR